MNLIFYIIKSSILGFLLISLLIGSMILIGMIMKSISSYMQVDINDIVASGVCILAIITVLILVFAR